MKYKNSKMYKEDIMGDAPVYHVFYANETKSQQFGDRASALSFRKRLESGTKRSSSRPVHHYDMWGRKYYTINLKRRGHRR